MRLIVMRNPELNNAVYVFRPWNNPISDYLNISHVRRLPNGEVQYQMSSDEIMKEFESYFVKAKKDLENRKINHEF